MKKLLVIGANGFLGRKILYKFKEIFEIYAADLNTSGIPTEFNPIKMDITDKVEVKKIISDISPNLTILTAAMTNVDACEDFFDKAHNINTLGPLYVAESIKKIDGRLIHISTDFIFDGKKGDYKESDEFSPLSRYGKTKLAGEIKILAQKITALICRTSVLFGWPESDQNDNFFSWAYKSLSQNKKLTIIDGQITSPTLVDDLVEFLFSVSNFSESEIYHTTGPESISRYKFISKLIDVFEFDPNLLIKVNKFNQKAQRPENSSLNTSKIQNINKYKFKNIVDSFKFLKKSK
jgi:dTDP-4-dehydrorhamnose reductase